MSRIEPSQEMDLRDWRHAAVGCSVATLPRQQQLNRQWSAFIWIFLAAMAGTVLTAIGGEPGYARFESASDSFLGIYDDLASPQNSAPQICSEATGSEDVVIVRCPPRLLNVAAVSTGSPRGNPPSIARVQVVIHELSALEQDQGVQADRSSLEY